MDETLYLYNTAHRRKEPFNPSNPPEVGFYSCGPTVYHYAHIGNLRSFLFADILKRVLIMNGYQVNHIMNITDVGHLTDDASDGDDKMEKGAKREGKTAWEVAEFYTEAFIKDFTALNMIRPAIFPKATDHIQEQIDLIKTLEEKGYTYVIDDGVYFDTSKFADYGKMAKLNLDEQKEGARVQKNDQKRNGSDFALWKFSLKGENRAMEWESPWGKGFPGWHLECSAMSMKYLGDSFDIHTGGIDHIAVHHTNEIAQSEAATDKPFAHYWMHNEFVVESGSDKMSKSSGEFLTLNALIKKGYDPLDYRFATLQTHYRGQMTFSWAVMDAAREGRKRLNQFARKIHSLIEMQVERSDEKYLSDKSDTFREALNDDLNTPMALSIIFELVKDINSQIANEALAVSPASIWKFLLEADKVLGLDLEKIALATESIPAEIEELLAKRQLARDNRDFEASDRLRDQIKELGYLVEDGKDGQSIRPL